MGAVRFIFLSEYLAQPFFLPLYAVDHIEIIEEGENKDEPNLAHEQQTPQQEKKAPDVHGISDQGIRAMSRKASVLVKGSEAPNLDQFSKQAHKKCREQQGRFYVREQEEEKNKTDRIPKCNQKTTQCFMVEDNVYLMNGMCIHMV